MRARGPLSKEKNKKKTMSFQKNSSTIIFSPLRTKKRQREREREKESSFPPPPPTPVPLLPSFDCVFEYNKMITTTVTKKENKEENEREREGEREARKKREAFFSTPPLQFFDTLSPFFHSLLDPSPPPRTPTTQLAQYSPLQSLPASRGPATPLFASQQEQQQQSSSQA